MNRTSDGNERLGVVGDRCSPDHAGPAAWDLLARRLSRPAYGLLGATGDAVTVDELFAIIRAAHLRPQPTVIAHLNLHGVYLYQRHEEMRQLHDLAELVYFDGMPLVFWAKLLGLRVARQHP